MNSGLLGQKGAVRRRTYDSFNILLAESVGDFQGGAPRVVRFGHDGEDNVSYIRNQRGACTRFAYDELNRPVTLRRASCSSVCSSTYTRYDAAGRVIARWNSRGALQLNGHRDAAGHWLSGLDTLGFPRVRTDPMGGLEVTEFDQRGNIVIERRFQRRPSGQFELLAHTLYDYDELGDQVRSTQAIFETPIATAAPLRAPDAEFRVEHAAGRVTQAIQEFHLDAHGHAVVLRRAEGGLVRHRVDGQGRAYDTVDANGRRVFRVFDANGNTVRTYLFDLATGRASGQPIRNDTFVEGADFDELDREVARTDQYGNQWRTRYDSLGNLVRATDPLGNVVRYDYNVFREQVAITRQRTRTGLGGGGPVPPVVATREYDAAGNLVLIVDEHSHRTTFRYDPLDRLIDTVYDATYGLSDKREYDTANNVTVCVARSGLRKVMKYDLLDRNIRVDYDATGVAPADHASNISPSFAAFEYDGAGGMVRHENDFCRVEIDRDSRGYGLTERVTFGGIAGAPPTLRLRRAFDREGHVVRLTYPSGRQLGYSYGPSGLMTGVTNVAAASYPGRASNALLTKLLSYDYAGNRMAGGQFANGARTKVLYDGRGVEVERRAETSRGATLWRQQSPRDRGGHVRFETAVFPTGVRTRVFDLDSLYRLTSYRDATPTWWLNPTAVAPLSAPLAPGRAAGQATLDEAIGLHGSAGGVPVFAYDVAGNRIMTREPAVATVASVPNQLNQLVQVAGRFWTYDANGNQRSDGVYEFEYDVNDALSQIIDHASGGTLELCFRDALGRIVAEFSPGWGRFRVFEGAEILVELSGAGDTEYTLGWDGLAAHVAVAGEDYWLVRDSVRTVRLLMDGSAGIVLIPDYGPFGTGAPVAAPFTLASFAGMTPMGDLPFLSSFRRIYRADMGRYLQPDPAGFVDGFNLYAYAANSPLDKCDRLGLAKSSGLSRRAGPAVGEWAKFADSIRDLLGLPYEKSTKATPHTGNVNPRTGELTGAGLGCQGFVNAVLSKFERGSYSEQIPIPLGTRNIFLEYGGTQVRDEVSFADLGVDSLDKAKVYGVQSLYKTDSVTSEGIAVKRGSPSHVWFLVYSENVDQWVRVEASSKASRMITGIFPLKADDTRLFNVYDMGQMDNTIDFSDVDPTQLGLDIADVTE